MMTKGLPVGGTQSITVVTGKSLRILLHVKNYCPVQFIFVTVLFLINGVLHHCLISLALLFMVCLIPTLIMSGNAYH
jgi:hypothetical protein